MKFEEDEEYVRSQHWNRKEKKRKWPFYLVIGAVCFFIAWVMSGAMK